MDKELTDEQQEKIDAWFTYHPVEGPEQDAQYQAINEAAKALAVAIYHHSPKCADQTAALRKLREAIWTAQSSIACKGV